MPRKISLTDGPNWETIVFVILHDCIKIMNYKYCFNRSQWKREASKAVEISKVLGHKEKPDHPIETLQRTIQDLRDKGYIDFLDRGEYRLTPEGIKKMEEVMEKIEKKIEDGKKAKKILEKYKKN